MKWSEFANQTCTVTTSAAKMLPKQAKIKVAKTDLIPVLQSKQEPEIKVHDKIQLSHEVILYFHNAIPT